MRLPHFTAPKDKPRNLRIVSFERELELLRFALEHADQFDHFAPFIPAIQTLLETGQWTDGHLSWELREGDFREMILKETYRPHLIYFDPYSSKKNREMWTVDCFKSMRAISREDGTCSLLIRRRRRFGWPFWPGDFFLGKGPASGPKKRPPLPRRSCLILRIRWAPSGLEDGSAHIPNFRLSFHPKVLLRFANLFELIRNSSTFREVQPMKIVLWASRHFSKATS